MMSFDGYCQSLAQAPELKSVDIAAAILLWHELHGEIQELTAPQIAAIMEKHSLRKPKAKTLENGLLRQRLIHKNGSNLRLQANVRNSLASNLTSLGVAVPTQNDIRVSDDGVCVPSNYSTTNPRQAHCIFIGHGRSSQWILLKDFLVDRLGLRYEEYNRVETAGQSRQDRVSEMLANVSFALLMLTAEDEQSDGSVRARENVVHEAGLFQGKLGFRRAIILLEDGCNEFSNLAGLDQIRFPVAHVLAKSENIRRVLEREGIVPSLRSVA